MTRHNLILLAALAFLSTSAPSAPVRAGEIAEAPAFSTRVRDLGAVDSPSAALLLSGQVGGTLPGAALWCAEPAVDGTGNVPLQVFVELDGGALLDNSPSNRVPLVISAYALDENGRIVDHLAQGIIIEGEGARPALASGGLKFFGRMTLPPRTVSLRMIARVYGTEAFILTRHEMRLSAPGSNEASLSAPLFADREGEWIVVRQDGFDEEAGCAGDVVPAALPVLNLTQKMNFVTTATDWPEGARLELAVADGKGLVVAYPSLTVGKPRPVAGSIGEIVSVEISPFDVPPGEYRLFLHLSTAAGEELATRSMPAVLLHHEPSAVWAGLAERTWQDTSQPVAEIAGNDRFRDREILTAYVEVLNTLANGDPNASRSALADLERSLFVAHSTDGLRALGAVEQKVAAQLARRTPMSLPPVVMLHREVYRIYSAYAENSLASHSWQIAAELAQIVGIENRRPELEGFAEAVLVSLASDLARRAAPFQSAILLERALAISPDFAPALLGLAALHERFGDREQAHDALARLVAVDPENAEARLRLGIVLSRTDRPAAAQEVLRALIDSSPPEWILSNASQELASLLVKEQRLGEAERLLADAISRVTSDQPLIIQLSWVQDLSGRPTEATATLEHIERGHQRQFESARLRYTQWPDLGEYENRAKLRQMAAERLPDLRRALETGRFR
jgi:tetratricopeptide (TPR) repeat protein